MEEIIKILESSKGTVDMGLNSVMPFVVTIILSMLFGLALKFLYHFYFRGNQAQDSSIARSLLLLTPAFGAVFFMVQTNLTLSLGLLGSLSFVRYRTPVKRSEDISFIILSIATALSAATGDYLIGVFLLLIIFFYSDCKKRFFEKESAQSAILTFNSKKVIPSRNILNAIEKEHLSANFMSSRTYDGIQSMVFQLNLPKEGHDKVNELIQGLDREAQISIFYPSDRMN